MLSVNARRKQKEANEARKRADSTLKLKCWRSAMTRPAQTRKNAISKLPDALSISQERMLKWNMTPNEAEAPVTNAGSAIRSDIEVNAMFEVLLASSQKEESKPIPLGRIERPEIF